MSSKLPALAELTAVRRRQLEPLLAPPKCVGAMVTPINRAVWWQHASLVRNCAWLAIVFARWESRDG